jgi:hypothetical protein
MSERLEAETLRLATTRPELLDEMRRWAQPNEHEPEQQWWQLLLDAALTAMAVDARTIAVLSKVKGNFLYETLEYRVSLTDGTQWDRLTLDDLHLRLDAIAADTAHTGQAPDVQFRKVFHSKSTPWTRYVAGPTAEEVDDARRQLVDAARADSHLMASAVVTRLVDTVELDAHAIADRDIEIARLARIESAEHAAWVEECRVSMKAHETYLAEHDDQPDTYHGHPQPGASPSYYGPDDVVVDGDWLVQLEIDHTFATSRLAEYEAAAAATSKR